MIKNRKPILSALGITLALGAIATPAAVAQTQATPAPSSSASSTPNDAVAAAKADLERLEAEAAKVSRDLDKSKTDQAAAQRSYDDTTKLLESQQTLVDEMRSNVGRVAAAERQQSMSTNVMGAFFGSESDDSFLSNVSTMQSVEAITAEQFTRLQSEETRLNELKSTQAKSLETVNAEVEKQTQLKKEYDAKVQSATMVVAQLSSDQKKMLEALKDKAQSDAQAASLAAALAGASRAGAPIAGTPSGSSKGVWPADGPITSPFGYRNNPVGGYGELHDGTDVGAPCGAPVRASWSGVVVSSQYEGGWGNRVIVDSGKYKAAYNHLTSSAVSAGQVVTAGQVIASVGTTGLSTGCHLHFSTWVDGTIVDPQTIF